MESLLDTNEQVQAALNAHQRATLSAKKSLGIEGGASTPTGTPGNVTPSPDLAAASSGAAGGGVTANGSGSAPGSSSRSGSRARRDNGKAREDAPLPALPPRDTDKGKGAAAATYDPPPGPPPGRADDAEDPFRDPQDEPRAQQEESSFLPREALALDSFHPGFQTAGSASAPKKERDDDLYDSGVKR